MIAQLGVDLQHLVSGWRDYARWGRFLKPAPYTAAAATTAACLLVLADIGLHLNSLQTFGDWIASLQPTVPSWLRGDPATVQARSYKLDYLSATPGR